LLSAIEQASVVDGETLSIDRAALRDALDSTADFRGILGTLTCDDYGDCGPGRSVIHLHEDSGVTDPSLLPVVYPESLGVVEIGSGQPIEVRALLSALVVPDVSSPIQTAIEIAIEDFGPIHGHQVSVEILDEMCSGAGGRAAAEAVVADAQVVGVIGTMCSGAAVEASPILSAAGLSMISPYNTSPVLTSDLAGNAGPDHHKGYYRVSDNDLIEAGVVAQFSYDELELRTMVTVHDGDPYTSVIANAFAVAFREHGGAVPVVARVEKGQADMAAVIAQFDEADPDGVFIPLFPMEVRSLIQQAARLGALDGVTMIVAAAAFTTEILALPESEGFYFSAPDPGDSGNTNQTTGKSAADVLAAFEVAFGGPSSYPYWAHGYDATTLLLSAIEQASVVDGETLSIDRAALRDALDSTADFRGILGTLTCDDYGDCGPGRSVIHLHEDSGVTDSSLLPVVYTGARDTRLPQQ
jgi:branched-chain amino acid transport system substrate-binding protein